MVQQESSDCAAPEKSHQIPVLLKAVQEEGGVLRVETRDETILKALVEEHHKLDPLSSAYCLRRHPHDAHVVLNLPREEGLLAAAQFRESLKQLWQAPTTPGEEAQCCWVLSPTLRVANILRRALFTRVPVVAFTQVQVHSNTSRFQNEQICHRLGLLALQSCKPKDKAHLCVQGRAALARDLFFESGETRVAPVDSNGLIVKLSKGEEFCATCHCSRGLPLEHAKFHCVAAPRFWPELRFTALPTEEQLVQLRSSGYAVDSELQVRALEPDAPVRKEALLQVVSELPALEPFTRTWVGVESLGQYSAADIVARALAAIDAEIDLALNWLQPRAATKPTQMDAVHEEACGKETVAAADLKREQQA